MQWEAGAEFPLDGKEWIVTAGLEEEIKMKSLEKVVGRTVVVGLDMDSSSGELLSWALAKVAEPGDRVVALHVLHKTEIIGKEGKPSFLSLVKAFESILAGYDGLCSLKKIDLKFKIFRGSSARRVLVREAKSIAADIVVVGIDRNCKLRFSASFAQYCARKLPLECWVIAANHGKVEFQRKSRAGYTLSGSIDGANLCLLPYCIKSRKSEVFNNGTLENDFFLTERKGKPQSFQTRKDFDSDSSASCIGNDFPGFFSREDSSCSEGQKGNVSSSAQPQEGAQIDSLALVSAELSESEAASRLNFALTSDSPMMNPGWPLLHKGIKNKWQATERLINREISVVEWAMKLPKRHSISNMLINHENMGTKLTANSAIADTQQVESKSHEDGGAVILPGENFIPNNSAKQLEHLLKNHSSPFHLFSYQELCSATSNFSSDNLIWKGRNSHVYKGQCPGGKEVAIKILKQSQDAEEEICLEIDIMSSLHHENIISLLGFCFEENKLILVHDFVPRGCLEENLHVKKANKVLSWGNRFKVAIGVAEALDYLHNDTPQPVIHRDVKSTNILLDENFEPQLSDFGLAVWGSMPSANMDFWHVAGTFGYLAPEYFLYGKVSNKVDVYAFGIVLLELLSGRKPISNEYPKGQESLVLWAKPILESGKFMELLDPSLGNDYDSQQMEKMILAASLCIRREPHFRPQMSLILKLLQGDDAIMNWAKSQVVPSEGFDSLCVEESMASNVKSYLHLALLGIDDDSLSVSSSTDPSISCLSPHKTLDDYLQESWSCSSGLD